MKKITILPFLIVAAAMSHTALRAQNTGYNQQIEVTREYTPEVSKALRKDVAPNRVDTVMMRPEVSYTIAPTACHYDFVPRPLGVVRMSTSEWAATTPFYTKVGIGYPFRSLADFYFTPVRVRNAVLGAYANHRGIEAMTDNESAERVSMLSIDNGAGIYSAVQLDSRTKALVSVDYLGGVYNAYGGRLSKAIVADNDEQKKDDKINRLWFNDFGFNAAVETDFDKSDLWNYRVDLGAGLFARNSRQGNMAGQNRFGLSGELAKGWNGHVVDLAFGVQGNYGRGTMRNVAASQVVNRFDGLYTVPADMKSYNDMMITIAPSYRYANADGLQIVAGVDWIYDRQSLTKAKNHVMPNLQFAYRAVAEAVPYASLRGRMLDGSLRSLVMDNRYMLRDTWLLNGTVLETRFGISGTVRSFKYDAWGSVGQYQNYHFAANTAIRQDVQSIDILPDMASLSTELRLVEIGGKFDIRIVKGLFFDMQAEVRLPKAGKNNWGATAVGISKFSGQAAFKYQYANRLFLSLGVDANSATDYSMAVLNSNGDYAMTTVSVPFCYSVDLTGEYKLNDKLNIFLEGRNLTNHTNYTYLTYRKLGINFLGGIKLNF